MLKTHTREVLYERFRTEKLLVRRATQKIGEKEAKRLFEGAQRLSMSRHSDLADVRTYRRSRALTYLSFLCLIMEETSATRSPSHTRSFIILFLIPPHSLTSRLLISVHTMSGDYPLCYSVACINSPISSYYLSPYGACYSSSLHVPSLVLFCCLRSRVSLPSLSLGLKLP